MDLAVLKTFLEIAATGSFARAAETLHVAPTTVSARIKLLEAELGHALFVRNRSGAALTVEGEALARHAATMLRVWDRARHQLGRPKGLAGSLAIGGELSLWHPLLLDWLIWMRRQRPDLAIHARVGLPDEIVRMVAEGALDLAVVYTPTHRPGLRIEPVFEDRLVMVTTDPSAATIEAVIQNAEGYVLPDWGEDFQQDLRTTLPEAAAASLSVNLGPLALEYVLRVGGAGYFRHRIVKPHLEAGRLTVVSDASEFAYTAYAVSLEKPSARGLKEAIEGFRLLSAKVE